MVAYILEILNLLLLFFSLGYEFHSNWKFVTAGIGLILVEVVILMFVSPVVIIKMSLFLQLIPPFGVMLLLKGRPFILVGMGICLMQVFSMLDSFVTGIWILVVKGDMMAVDLELTYILGELMCLFVFLLLAILCRKKRKSIHRNIEKINPFIFVLFFVGSILINYNPWYIGETSTLLPQLIHGRNLVKNGVLAIAVIIIFVLIYGILMQKKELKRMVLLNERCISEQAEQYRLVSEEDLKLRKFRHDYNAHLAVLQSIAASGDVKKMEDYVATLTALKNERKLVSTNNLVCDAILSRYMTFCKEEDIILKIRGNFPGDAGIRDTDLCVLISNGVQNAYEAVRKCASNREISVSIGNTDSCIVITIVNTLAEIPVLIDGKPVTTKEDKKNHGLGTQNMLETVEKNGGHITWNILENRKMQTEIMLGKD